MADYLWLNSDVPYTAFAGEWLFAEALYGAAPEADAALRRRGAARHLAARRTATSSGCGGCAPRVEPFLDALPRRRSTGRGYTFVGFTSTFQQNIASLALAARVKARPPGR